MPIKHELGVPLHELAEHVSPVVFKRYAKEGWKVPKKGPGKHSLINAEGRARVSLAQGGDVFDAKEAKRRRRIHNKNLHRPAGRIG